MKLLFVIKALDSAIGGAERVLCDICTELTDRNHEVFVATFDNNGGKPFYFLGDKVNVIRLGIGDSSQKAGFFDTLKRCKALRKLSLEIKPDVAIGFMHSVFVPLAFSLIGSGIPVVASEHIVPEHYKNRPVEFFLFQLAAFSFSRITVISEVIRNQYPIRLQKLMVPMPNPVMAAVDFEGFDKCQEHQVLLNVGRLDPQKDHETLINAFSLVSNKFPDWKLKIFGAGPLLNNLENQIESLNLQERVQLAGTTDKISEEYIKSDIFVISSRYESFGLVTAEAMSYGLPVAGFADCPGTNELIIDGCNGFLVDPTEKRYEALAKALDKLMGNKDLRNKMGVAGKKSIGKDHSIESVASRWEKLLKEVSSKDSVTITLKGQ